MTKKRNLVIANWKMNPTELALAKDLVSKAKRFSTNLKKTEVVIAPPHLYLQMASKAIGKSKKISLGAQNCHYKNSGSHTGEVSPAQLKDLGVRYTIVGHSERRSSGETSGDINEKIKTLLADGVTPVVCVGEKERDREGKYLDFLKNQIKETLSSLSVRDFMNIVIAYEPVWAIGKSFDKGPSGTDVHEMSLIIRKILGELFGNDYATPARIIYGGAVEIENTEDIMRKGGVSGLLVGHASLEPLQFKEILKIVDSVK